MMPVKRAVTNCNMPHDVPADEASLYARLRSLHCAQQQESHDCSGRLTIDRNGITLSCPLCGDARGKFSPASRPSTR